ncbi:MAG TPA: hypothetical protein VG866_00930 [Candidatus Paceibacterota bacterium]|nr:hypothetical protein [Candidatus Paceibacterota bacterium]
MGYKWTLTLLVAVIVFIVAMVKTWPHNKLVLRTWSAGRGRQAWFAAAVLAGVVVIFILARAWTEEALLVGAIVAAGWAMTNHWAGFQGFLKVYWFRVLTALVIVGALYLELWRQFWLLSPESRILVGLGLLIVVFWTGIWSKAPRWGRWLVAGLAILVLISGFVQASPRLAREGQRLYRETVPNGFRAPQVGDRVGGNFTYVPDNPTPQPQNPPSAASAPVEGRRLGEDSDECFSRLYNEYGWSRTSDRAQKLCGPK